MVHAGFATHYCEYSKLGELEAALANCSNYTEIKETLQKFCPVDQTDSFSLQPHIKNINDCFSGKTVEEIISNLKQLNSKWSHKALKVFILLICTI